MRVVIVSQNGQHVVSVGQATFVVEQDHAIGVAIKSDTCVHAMRLDQFAEARGVGTHIFRTGMVVDVQSVWVNVEGNHGCSQSLENLWGDRVVGAIGTVDQQLETAQVQTGLCCDQVLDVKYLCLGHCGFRGNRTLWQAVDRIDQLLNRGFFRFIQLHACGAEKFDAILRGRIVRG